MVESTGPQREGHVEHLNLSDLLADVAAEGPEGLAAAVTGIAYRSDEVRPGDAFFCVTGLVRDGHDFAADAAARGASAIVVAHRVGGLSAPQVVVPNVRVALALASARFFGEPSKDLRVAGITGTNGKTTTTYLLDSILRFAGSVTGVIGTVGTRIADIEEGAARTTPESRDLQRLLARMRDAGVDSVSMEVSSHAIDLHRVDGVRFAVAAFTNLTQDHLDYHGSLEEYLAVKTRLLESVPAECRVIDIDGTAGREMAERLGARWTVGLSPLAVVRAEHVVLGPSRTLFRLCTPDGAADVTLPLVGDFNVSNALVAAGCALALGVSPDQVVQGLDAATQVPGRLERVDEGQPFSVLVDYAHTPDGLRKALETARGLAAGRVLVVFGCGGDRDNAKRPLMGAIAAELADVAIVTNDNPRTEGPQAIIAAILLGMDGARAEVRVEPDRRTAIAQALQLAGTGDVVLLAGKGHEDYQILGEAKVRFDDREVAREELRHLW
jgi:UDP-N-acetylmuramoyl-L-alanyl-D-glutamate--2,6-diaminopimelate ligase